jgi:hypothetical protein
MAPGTTLKLMEHNETTVKGARSLDKILQTPRKAVDRKIKSRRGMKGKLIKQE